MLYDVFLVIDLFSGKFLYIKFNKKCFLSPSFYFGTNLVLKYISFFFNETIDFNLKYLSIWKPFLKMRKN